MVQVDQVVLLALVGQAAKPEMVERPLHLEVGTHNQTPEVVEQPSKLANNIVRLFVIFEC